MTDEQALLTNEVMMVERFGESREIAYENLGRHDYPLNELKRAAEDLFLADVAAEAKKKDPAFQMQIAQMQQEAAMQQQEAQNQTQGMRTEVSAGGMQGVDMRGGGSAPAPGNTFEKATGTSRAAGIGMNSRTLAIALVMAELRFQQLMQMLEKDEYGETDERRPRQGAAREVGRGTIEAGAESSPPTEAY